MHIILLCLIYTYNVSKYWVSAVWLIKAERKVKCKHSEENAHCTWNISLASQPPANATLQMQKARSPKRGLVKCIYSPCTVLCTPITFMQAIMILEICQVPYIPKIWRFWLELPNKKSVNRAGSSPIDCYSDSVIVCLVVDAYYERGNWRMRK